MPGGGEYFEEHGAAPARSALRLRLVLAAIGIAMFVAIAVVLAAYNVPVGWVIAAVALAVIGVIDLGVVVARLRRARR